MDSVMPMTTNGSSTMQTTNLARMPSLLRSLAGAGSPFAASGAAWTTGTSLDVSMGLL